MNWSAGKTIIAALTLMVLVGGIVYSAGGQRGGDTAATAALERRVTSVEHEVAEDDRDDRQRDQTIARMAESIEWIRRWLQNEGEVR